MIHDLKTRIKIAMNLIQALFLN